MVRDESIISLNRFSKIKPEGGSMSTRKMFPGLYVPGTNGAGILRRAIKKKWLLTAAVASFLFASWTSEVLAKDICVSNAFGQFLKFDNFKVSKGKTTPLTGRLHPDVDDLEKDAPFNGAVTLSADGVTTRIGIIAYAPVIDPDEFSTVAWYMTGNALLSATGDFDNSPFNGVDGADTWTSTSCTNVPIAAPIRLGEGPIPGRK